MDFLTLLRDDIREGLARTDPEYRRKHTLWLIAQQRPEGGFANRRGRADLYYTTFALRSLSALSALTPEIAELAAGFLLRLARQPDSIRTRQPNGAFCDAVCAASWWDSLRLCEEVLGPRLIGDENTGAMEATAVRLAALRRGDGGWGKTDIDACGSLYHSFLAACAFARMDRPLPEAEKVHLFVKSMDQPAGGFLENCYSKRPGTNGSAGGVSLSLLLGILNDMEKHAAFIAGMISGEGGFYATPAAPIADLLSTYAALFTLRILGQEDARLTRAAAGYARSLEQSSGGYTGFALESVVDCEYTFYGLGVESIAPDLAHS